MSCSRMLGCRIAVALTIVLLTSGVASAGYLETFDVADSDNHPLSEYGWLAYLGSGCTDGNDPWIPDNWSNVSYDKAIGGQPGFAYTNPSKFAGSINLLGTDAGTLPVFEASAVPTTTISWYQWVIATDMTARVAVNVGGTWYASADTFTTSYATTDNNYTKGQDAKSMTLSPTSLWHQMTIDKGFELSMATTSVNLPTGDLIGAGLCVSGSTFFVFDNFQVGQVPEPATMTVLGTAALGLLAYAWRKRKWEQ